MHRPEKSQATITGNPDNTTRFSLSEKLDDSSHDDYSYNSKMKVECICPKCGQKHVMAFHWIGRGTPRKYCHSCKGGSNG